MNSTHRVPAHCRVLHKREARNVSVFVNHVCKDVNECSYQCVSSLGCSSPTHIQVQSL